VRNSTPSDADVVAAGCSAPPPASAKAGIVLFSLAVGGFAIGTTEFAAMSLVPYFSAELGIDAPTAGHVISAYALGVVVGAPVIAVLGAKLSRRTLLIGLMAMFSIANLLSALSPSYGWMMAFRFLSGLPHGAYFGVCALVAATLVPPNRRARAVALAMLGLTIATTIGVPLATLLGQTVGWRWGFGAVGVLAAITACLCAGFAPRDRPAAGAGPLRELGALKRSQVLLTLAIGAVGFGGMFAVYTYLASTLLTVTAAPPAVVPLIFAVFGVGLTLGTLAAAAAADRAQSATIGTILVASVGILACYPFAVGSVSAMVAVVFAIGATGGLATVLQTRLMDVAADAQTLAAALNHSAFNVANALGPWLAGLAIAGGYGFASAGWVGSALAAAGIAIWLVSLWDDRRLRRRA